MLLRMTYKCQAPGWMLPNKATPLWSESFTWLDSATPMQILQELLNSATIERPVTAGAVGPHLIAVASRRLGLAASLHRPARSGTESPVEVAENLAGKNARDLANWLLEDRWLKAGVGMAALNSILETEEKWLVDQNAKEIIESRAEGKNLLVVGHFPFVEGMRSKVRRLWVMEKKPGPGDLSEEEGYRHLAKADVVAITGSSLINHTFDQIMASCDQRSFKIMLGPSTPLSPILFDHGLDVLGGVLVEDESTVLNMVREGATFRQLQGVRTMVMSRGSI